MENKTLDKTIKRMEQLKMFYQKTAEQGKMNIVMRKAVRMELNSIEDLIQDLKNERN